MAWTTIIAFNSNLLFSELAPPQHGRDVARVRGEAVEVNSKTNVEPVLSLLALNR